MNHNMYENYLELFVFFIKECLCLYLFLENIRQFWIQDNNFYSLLETTKWLKYISYCLQKAIEVCDHLNLGISVVLQGMIFLNLIYCKFNMLIFYQL